MEPENYYVYAVRYADRAILSGVAVDVQAHVKMLQGCLPFPVVLLWFAGVPDRAAALRKERVIKRRIERLTWTERKALGCVC